MNMNINLGLLFCILFGISDGDKFANVTSEPTAPSLSPTLRPSLVPTEVPTDYPTVEGVTSDLLIVVNCTVPVANVTNSQVTNDKDYLEGAFADAAELDVNDVDIRVLSTIENPNILSGCGSSGVNVQFAVISDDESTYTSIRQNVDSGFFVTQFDDSLGYVYGEGPFVCTNVSDSFEIVNGYTLQDKDVVYPPEEEPTFTEKLWSEYLFFGFFTSLFGVVWLWYLRTDVDDGNIYLPNNEKKTAIPAKSASNNGAAGGANGGNNGTNLEMTGTKDVQGSQNALLDANDAAAAKTTTLGDYAAKNDGVLDQRDDNREP